MIDAHRAPPTTSIPPEDPAVRRHRDTPEDDVRRAREAAEEALDAVRGCADEIAAAASRLDARLSAVEASSARAADALEEIAAGWRLREEREREAASVARVAEAAAAAQRATAIGRMWEAAGSRWGLAVLGAVVLAVLQVLDVPMPRVVLDPAGPIVVPDVVEAAQQPTSTESGVIPPQEPSPQSSE